MINMLDEKKTLMIDLLLSGTMNKTDIAKTLGVSRQTIYDWIELEEVKVEVDKRRRDLENSKKIANDIFLTHMIEVITEYRELMKKTKNDMVKKQASEYWIDRGLGKMTTKIEATTLDNNNLNKLTTEDVEAELAALRGNEEEV